MGHPDASVSAALACEGRWRTQNAGVSRGAKTGFSDASVSIPLALRREPKQASLALVMKITSKVVIYAQHRID
jgi:hypothetical protein